MEAPFQIVGCVLASRPAAELIDAFATQMRRERAAVMSKTAQGATFVRFNTQDTKLVTLACRALRGQVPAVLRFGFAIGTKETSPSGAADPQDGIDVGTRVIVLANQLAAGAGDGEVLVSPQLAVILIEAGFALRSRQVALPGGRIVPACSLDLAATPAQAAPKAPGLAAPEAPAQLLQKADALGTVFRTLMAQAEEMTRRQGELEARQDAVLGKMTLVDEGNPSARHLSELESELDAQLARVGTRLEFIDKLEQRVNHLQSVVVGAERKLADQLRRRAELESLQVLGDTLVTQMVEAQDKLAGVAAAQERLLPMTAQVPALVQTLEDAQRLLASFAGRLGDLDRGAEALDQKIRSLAEGEGRVQAVRAELEALQQIGSRSRADLQFVADQAGVLADLRAKVEDLLGRVEDTDRKIETVESRRKAIEEVQSHASAITHMLGDIQLKLEMLDEQRAEIDHVGGQLARLDFSVQEAQNTLRALQREREVAERIEQGIKALRARSGAV